jgi:large subunit ribosomal protein L1
VAEHGKRYRALAEKIERGKTYSPEEAVRLVKETSKANFDTAVEAHFRLGVDPKQADQLVRGTAVLPHGTGKKIRVAVFATGEKAREAEAAGADVVGADDLSKRIEGGWLDFDIAVATPDLMAMVGRLGRVLGPRGLMPNPRSGTVTNDIGKAVRDAKGGRVEFRVDKTGVVHTIIGKASFSEDQLMENFATLVDALVRAKRDCASTTFGPEGRFVLKRRSHMPKTAKLEKVDEIEQTLDDVAALVLTDYRALKVAELQELRRRLRKNGIEYHVVKNTLFRIAAKERGLPDIERLLSGPMAIAITKTDEVELAKGIVDETRTLKTLKIYGGVVRGRVMGAEDINALAALPGKASLQATIVGALAAPLTQLVATLEAPLRELVATFTAKAAQATD